MTTALPFLSISYGNPSAPCHAPLCGWRGRAERFEERGVLGGGALRGLAARGAQPRGSPASPQGVLEVGHSRSVAPGIVLATSQKSSAAWFLKGKPRKGFHAIYFCIACSRTQRLRCPPEMSVRGALSLMLGSEEQSRGATAPSREAAHDSTLSNTKCMGTTCNRVITASIYGNGAVRAAIGQREERGLNEQRQNQ